MRLRVTRYSLDVDAKWMRTLVELTSHSQGQSSSSSSKPTATPLCFKMAAKFGFEMCFAPSTLGVGAKTRLHAPKAVPYHEQYHTL